MSAADKNTGGIALVTGASSGIGTAFVRALAAAAAGRARYPGLPAYDELWLVARRADRLDALAAEIRAESGGVSDSNPITVRAVPLDLVAPDSLKKLADLVAASGKPLRLFVNNAGYGTYGPFSDVDLDTQLGQIDLNCRVLTEACGRLGPHLRRGSLVINTASMAGFAPLGNFAVYAATKAYALSFSVALAAEWEGRGVRVCALCPGSVQSEFALVASGGARKEVLHGYSAEKTVDHCLRKAAGGAWIAIARVGWKLNRLATGVFGPKTTARFAYRFMKRPHAGDAVE